MWLEKNKTLEKKILSEIDVVESRLLQGGIINSIYYVRLKDKTTGVLKITNDDGEDWVLKKERAILQRFDHKYFPRLLSYGSIKKFQVNFNLVSFLKGKNMNSLGEHPSEKVFTTLCDTLVDLHSNSEKIFGFVYDFNKIGADPRILNSYPGPYNNGFEQHFIPAKGWVEHLVKKESRYSGELKVILSRMEKKEDLFKKNECTYNHGDYQFKNILIHKNHITGILDFDSFRFGDPSSDLHMFLQNCVDNKILNKYIQSFLNRYADMRDFPINFFKKGSFYRYYTAVQKVISLPFHLRNFSAEMTARYKQKVKRFLQSIVDYSDAYLKTINEDF